MEKTGYTSDLNDKEWHILKPYFRDSPRRGPKRKWCIRQVLDAVFYLLKTGCQWRNLPKGFPPWQTVFYHFRCWMRSGIWFRAHESLRRATRKKAGHHPDPSAAISDSQSVKTTAEGCWFSGFDGNKKVKGRKRHLLVDTLGLLLWVYTTPANVGQGLRIWPLLRVDKVSRASFRRSFLHLWVFICVLSTLYTSGAARRASSSKVGTAPHFYMRKPCNVGERWAAKGCGAGMMFSLPRLKTIWADGGYTGDDLAQSCARNGWNLVVVKRPQGRFEVQPKHWIVERTLAWLLKSRRLVLDYERKPQTGESFIKIAMIRLMVRRLAVSGKAGA